MKKYLKLLVIALIISVIFIPSIRVNALTLEGKPELVVEELSSEGGIYSYNLSLKFEDWLAGGAEEGETPLCLIDGYEIYEKVNNAYTTVYSNNIENPDFDTAKFQVNVNKGEVKTYAIRVYAMDMDENLVYSEYSEDVVLDHRPKTTIMMRVHNGKGCYSFTGGGMHEYVCGERDHDEVGGAKVGETIFTVLSGTEVTVKAYPAEGYALDGWYGYDPAGGKQSTSVILISDAMEYSFTASELVEGDYFTTGPAFVQKISYNVIEGANQTYTIDNNKEAKFRIDADYSLFEDGGVVLVDDQEVEPTNYTSASGSTIITLKKEYVDTLSEGEHTLTVLFNDNGTASTTFNVTRKNSDNGVEITPPDTGLYSKSNIMIYLFILLATILSYPKVLSKDKNY